MLKWINRFPIEVEKQIDIMISPYLSLFKPPGPPLPTPKMRSDERRKKQDIERRKALQTGIREEDFVRRNRDRKFGFSKTLVLLTSSLSEDRYILHSSLSTFIY
jgi:hypothetical protein